MYVTAFHVAYSPFGVRWVYQRVGWFLFWDVSFFRLSVSFLSYLSCIVGLFTQRATCAVTRAQAHVLEVSGMFYL